MECVKEWLQRQTDVYKRQQLNSDAHYPERINNSRAEALAALKKVGFDTVVEWHGGQWKSAVN